MADDNTPTPGAPPPEQTPPPGATPPAGGGATADAPWHSAIFTPDGAFVDGWQTKLPASMDPHRAMLANYKDLPGLAKSLADSMTAARARPAGLVIPGSEASQEEKDKFQGELRKLWGVPENAEGYTLEKPASLPQGVEWSDDLAKGFAAKAAELGLTPKQAQALVQYDFDRLSTAQTAQNQEMETVRKAEQADMAKRWGPNVDATLMQASRMAVTLGMPNAKELFDPKSPMFAGPDMADAFARMAAQTGEQKLLPGAAIGNLDPETMAKDIISNPNNPDYRAYHDASQPNSAAVRARVSQLYKQAA